MEKPLFILEHSTTAIVARTLVHTVQPYFKISASACFPEFSIIIKIQIYKGIIF